ncbi:hypothetical protein [Jatrophihabitans fulvus]
MNIEEHINADVEVAALRADSTTIHEFGALVPVTATPAAIAAGVAAGAGLVGAAAGGAALGQAID